MKAINKKVEILNSELHYVDSMSYPFNDKGYSFLTITLKFDTRKEMKKEWKRLGMLQPGYEYVEKEQSERNT